MVDVVENIVTTDEKKPQILNAFFGSVFHGKISCSLCTQPPELEKRKGTRMKAP